MGCVISKPDTDVIRQCKERRKMIREAVNCRQEFAMAHAAYIQTLQNVGLSLRRFSEGGEVTITSPPSVSPSRPVLPRLTEVSLPSSPSPSASSAAVVSASTQDATVIIPLSPPTAATVAVSLPSLSPSPSSSPRPPASVHSPVASPSPSSAPLPHPDASAIAKPSTPSAGSPTLPVSISPRFSSPASSTAAPFFAQASSPSSDTMAPIYSVNGFGSPDRASDFSLPFYSPRRDDFDDYAYSPSPSAMQTPPPMPSPNRISSSWFSYDIFEPPPIPYNLLQNRRRIQDGEEDEDGDYDDNIDNDDNYVHVKDFDQIRKEEGIPDLEEDELREDEDNHGSEDEKGVGEEIAYSAASMEDRKVEIGNEKAAESAKEVKPEKETNGNVEPTPAESIPPSPPKEQEITTQAVQRGGPSEVAVFTGEDCKDLTGAVRHIHRHFSRACVSGNDVSHMLQTQLVVHRMTGLDSKESSKFFNAITTHWSQKASMETRYNSEDSDAPEGGMSGSHAATLERIYAWEKKLYEEVKAGEAIQMSFNRKRNRLHNLDAKGSDKEQIDKTRAELTKLENRLEVALKAIQLASEKIQLMTNDDLYPQLAELVGGLLTMWKVMWECHKAQKAIASEMQTIENSVAGNEASEAHIKATVALKHELENWQSQFNRWISSQKKYIDSLYEWLLKCHMMGADGFPDQNDRPDVFHFLSNWRSALERLESRDQVVQAIHGFASVVQSLEAEQQGELFLKKNAEKSARDLDYHSRSLERMEKKYLGYNGGSDISRNASSDVQSKRADIDIQRTLLENEQRKHSEIMQGRRERTLNSFREHLPSIFDAMASFSKDALKAYEAIASSKSLHITENGEMHIT